MDANARRNRIKEILKEENKPISATTLSRLLGVSRQVICGDIAILRAAGYDVVATARGYVDQIKMGTSQYRGKVACYHTPQDTKKELYAMVDAGATVVDVTVEHEFYGDISANLNLKSRRDVDNFMKKMKETKSEYLAVLTGGVHLHTLVCNDVEHFEEVTLELKELGFLHKV